MLNFLSLFFCSLRLGIYPARVALFRERLRSYEATGPLASHARSDISPEEEYDINQLISQPKIDTQHIPNYTTLKTHYLDSVHVSDNTDAPHGKGIDLTLQFNSSSRLVRLLRYNETNPEISKNSFKRIEEEEIRFPETISKHKEQIVTEYRRSPDNTTENIPSNETTQPNLNRSKQVNTNELLRHYSHEEKYTTNNSKTVSSMSSSATSLLHHSTNSLFFNELNETSGKRNLHYLPIHWNEATKTPLDDAIQQNMFAIANKTVSSSNDTLINSTSEDGLRMNTEDNYPGWSNYTNKEKNYLNTKQMDPQWMKETLSKLNRVIDSILRSIATGDIRVNEEKIAQNYKKILPDETISTGTNENKKISNAITDKMRQSQNERIPKISYALTYRKRRRRGKIKTNIKHVIPNIELKILNKNKVDCSNTINSNNHKLCRRIRNNVLTRKYKQIYMNSKRMKSKNNGNNHAAHIPLKHINKKPLYIYDLERRSVFPRRQINNLQRTETKMNRSMEVSSVTTDLISKTLKTTLSSNHSFQDNTPRKYFVINNINNIIPDFTTTTELYETSSTHGSHFMPTETVIQSNCLQRGSTGRLVVDGTKMIVVGGYTHTSRHECWSEVSQLIRKHMPRPVAAHQRIMVTSTFYYIARTAGLIGLYLIIIQILIRNLNEKIVIIIYTN